MLLLLLLLLLMCRDILHLVICGIARFYFPISKNDPLVNLILFRGKERTYYAVVTSL